MASEISCKSVREQDVSGEAEKADAAADLRVPA